MDLDPCHSSLSTSSKHTLTVQGKEPLLSTHPVAVINLLLHSYRKQLCPCSVQFEVKPKSTWVELGEKKKFDI